jgi:hypothetical protein
MSRILTDDFRADFADFFFFGILDSFLFFVFVSRCGIGPQRDFCGLLAALNVGVAAQLGAGA